ncbi:MAG: substrate-binding domain-containing protein, partial [Pseudonocardiaceae bacterium]
NLRPRTLMLQVKFVYSWASESHPGETMDAKLLQLLYLIHRTGSLNKAAQEIGLSYRYVWGLTEKWERLVGQPLVKMEKGHGTHLTPFGEKLLWAEQRVKARLAPQLDSISTELEQAFRGFLHGSLPGLTIHASHDMALTHVRDHYADDALRRIDLRFLGSVESLKSLAGGRCDLAGFHIGDNQGKASRAHLSYRQWLRPRVHRLIHFVTRQQGLMVAKGNPHGIRTPEHLLRPELRFINRQPGSGTRLLFDQLIWDAGINQRSIHGYDSEEFTHLAVAATIAGGMADVGFGIKAAAANFGLDFIPLTNEHYFLIGHKDALDRPQVVDLIKFIAGAEFRSVVAGLAGYDASQSGTVTDIRSALPWFESTGRRGSVATQPV